MTTSRLTDLTPEDNPMTTRTEKEAQAVSAPKRVEEITKFRTLDGEVFSTMEGAEYHAEQIELAAKANAVLSDGGSIADALRAVGKELSIEPIHEQITKDTKLVVEYWQCRSTPGYQVQQFLPNWKLNVWGNAGSWSGSYGGEVNLRDLARYAQHENTVGLKKGASK